MNGDRDQHGFPKGASVMGGTLLRLMPEVQRDEHGSYLPGDRSLAMAQAIAADIRRRALTEPGYLDHWKTGAASEQLTSAQKTNPRYEGRAVHARQVAVQAPRRSARLAKPARAPAPAKSARSRQAARRALEAAGVHIARAALSSHLGLGSCSISLRVVMAALCHLSTFQGEIALEAPHEGPFQ